MKKPELAFWFLIFAGVLPTILFLAGWWGTLGRVPENKIFIYAFTGFAFGIILNIILHTKIRNNLFRFNNCTLSFVYLFYSFCTFGFFMGIPVFNLLMGVLAVAYTARKSIYNGIIRGDFKKYLNIVSFFTSSVMFFVCLASGFIALYDKHTIPGIKNMSGFEFSFLSLLFIIIFGGIILIVSQYFLTKGMGILFYRNGKQ